MELYDLATLLEVMRNQKTSAPNFWLSFFPRQINFTTPQILWDRVYEDNRKLAPFVIPTVQGRPQTLAGYDTVAFAPAYIKIKDVVSMEMHVERLPGEAFVTGNYTLDQRRDAVIAELSRLARTKIENRWEWLAAKAVIDGKVTISGEDYPSTLVDFRRHSSLTATLLTTARWTESTAVPLTDLRNMRRLVAGRSGARVTRHIFGGDAWDYFVARVDLKEMMNRNYGGQDVQVTRIWEGAEGMEFMGVIQGLDGAGRMEIWVNTSKYIDPDTGSEAFYLDQKTVVGVSDAIQGVRCFGAINDKRAGYRALPIFVKNWDNEDPSVEYMLHQSAPLMVPRNPDASYSLKVAT